jgi:hypothetical protein
LCNHLRRYELELENEMRTFFRRYYTHSRYQSATQDALVQLHLHDKVREVKQAEQAGNEYTRHKSRSWAGS